MIYLIIFNVKFVTFTEHQRHLSLNQEDVENHDFDLYALTKYHALSEEFPRLTETERLPSLLVGLDPRGSNLL